MASVLSEAQKYNWAFALSGGGAKGAYAAGVVKYCETLKLFSERKVRAAYGVSTGALVAAAIGLDALGDLEHFYTHVRTEDILGSYDSLWYKPGDVEGAMAYAVLTGKSSLFNTDPLARLIKRVAGPNLQRAENCIQNRDVLDVAFITTNMETGEPFSFSNHTEHINATILMQGLLASASMPVFMPLVPITRGNDTHMYADGGVREFLPVGSVMSSPHRDSIDIIVSISLNPRDSVFGGDISSLFGIAGRAVSLLSYDIGVSDALAADLVNALLAVKGTVSAAQWSKLEKTFSRRVQDVMKKPAKTYKIIEITPKALRTRDPLQFNPDDMSADFALGFRDAEAAIAEALK